MQNGHHPSSEATVSGTNCTFCQRSAISYILKETPAFLLAADHAPLVVGHLLIIPKQHYTCYGDVPAELDAELFALKREIQQFLTQFYAPAVFWEHGVFRQTVFHAHLHCFPFGATDYNHAERLHDIVVHSQDDIRTWYTSRGDYFYLEDAHTALLFAPEMDRYIKVIQDVLWHGVLASGGQKTWRSTQQRKEEGKPLIEAMVANWHTFEQQGANYADESSAR